MLSDVLGRTRTTLVWPTSPGGALGGTPGVAASRPRRQTDPRPNARLPLTGREPLQSRRVPPRAYGGTEGGSPLSAACRGSVPCRGSAVATFRRQRGMPSMGRSSACPDCVPAICTHRPSLLAMAKRQRKGEVEGTPDHSWEGGAYAGRTRPMLTR